MDTAITSNGASIVDQNDAAESNEVKSHVEAAEITPIIPSAAGTAPGTSPGTAPGTAAGTPSTDTTGPRTGKQLWQTGAFKVKSSIGMSMAFKTLRSMHGDDFIPDDRLQRIKRLGAGAFGVVDLAWYSPRLGSVSSKVMVAVKQLKPEVFKNPDDLAMFLKEINLMKRISHPNLVDLVGIGSLQAAAPDVSPHPDKTTNGQADNPGDGSKQEASEDELAHMFIVQEYMAAGTLKNMVLKQQLAGARRVYSYQDAIRWCRQVAKGLSYLHNAKPMIIHRDMKLENVLLKGPKVGGMVAKVADFGLCACVDSWMEKRRAEQGHAHASAPPQLPPTPEDAITPASTPSYPPTTASTPGTATTTAGNGIVAATTTKEDPSSTSPADPNSSPSANTSANTTAASPAVSDPPLVTAVATGAVASGDLSSVSAPGAAAARSDAGSTGTPVSRAKTFRRGLTALSRAFSRKTTALPPVNLTYNLSGHTGSLMYMAPEVYRNEPYNEKSDVFSFSLILLEVFMGMVLATFTAPRGYDAEIEMYAKRVAEEGYRPDIPKYIPDSVAEIIRECWSADPAARPRMDDVARRLKDVEDSGEMAEIDLRSKAQSGCCQPW